MRNAITITQMMQKAMQLKQSGEKFSLLGIGPMSKLLIEAVIELAKEKDFPVLFIASRNQVDSDELGGGYVCKFDQARFVAAVNQVIEQTGFNGLCYLCRDHGGPWQRDEERKAKIPVGRAMEIASFSYAEDMKQGFDLLHIDPTKDPHVSGTVDLDIVLERTVQLIETAERDRERLGIPSLGYEVGTEETNGGLTSIEAFETFSRRLTEQLAERGLPRPLFIVGQTGTLTRLTENVGQYNTAEAIKLTETANRYGMGLKEHNGDYLSNAILLEHPAMTLDAMNVAPEFGVCETLANLDLCALEAKFISEGRSAVRQKMTEYAVKGERWRKWVMGATATAPVEEIFKDEALSEQILHICGHYTLEEPEVKSQLAVLYANVAKLGLDGKEYVKKRIKDSVDRYASCFNMYGLTSKLLGR